MDILLLVDPLYCARFWNPCFAPLIAPRITKLANMNFAVIPTVFSIPARPFPDVPRPLKEDRALFKVGIPDENFWIRAPKAPEDFWITPDASDFTPEPTPLMAPPKPLTVAPPITLLRDIGRCPASFEFNKLAFTRDNFSISTVHF